MSDAVADKICQGLSMRSRIKQGQKRERYKEEVESRREASKVSPNHELRTAALVGEEPDINQSQLGAREEEVTASVNRRTSRKAQGLCDRARVWGWS